MSGAFDLFVAGRPSVDVMFSGLTEWPELGKDVETAGLGVSIGTSFNTPAVANRIGLRVAYVATVGNDIWSTMIRDGFVAEGLSTDFLEIEDRPLPGVSVALNFAGDRGFVTYWSNDDYDEQLEARAIELVKRVDARHLHTYVDDASSLVTAARERGMTVSADAWGGSSWSSERPLADALAGVDVVFANESEARAMTGESDPHDAVAALAEHARCAVITRGEAGALGTADGEVREVRADPVPLVDATGAGDAFNAGFLRGWLGGRKLEDSLTLGVICGSRVVGDYGGYRGCPGEAEFRTIAAVRGIELPSSAHSSEGEQT